MAKASSSTETGSGEWNENRIQIIRKMCPAEISDDQFNLFIEQCKRSGLSPELREAFCVKRSENQGTKERPRYVTKYEFQPSESGMLARAELFPDFKGIQASVAYAEDEIVVDQGKGEVVHRFNPAKRKGSLSGAWARVVRENRLPIVVWLDFAGYVQKTPLWAKIPATMIEKCARVAALRKAYPRQFGGLYVREEMPAEEFQDAPPAPQSQEAAAPTPASAKPKKAEPVKVTGFPKPSTAGEKPQMPSAPAEPKASHNRNTVVAYGPYKGKTIVDLSDDHLGETVSFGHQKLEEQPKATWAKVMRENLTALEAEVAFRDMTDQYKQHQKEEGKDAA